MQKPNQLKKPTVLYVEDQQEVMEELSHILSLEVGKLYTASNGQEALVAMQSHEVDLIITDIQMPIMSGLEFLQKIREDDFDTPVIIATAFDEVEFLKQAINLQVDEYITKPIDINQLFHAITRIATVLFQKREIEQRDQIIQSMLTMKPYYSLLVDSAHLSKINQDIRLQLGFDKDDEIEIQAGTIEGGCAQVATVEDILQAIMLTHKDLGVIDNICKRKKMDADKTYIIKPYYFECTELFMLVFFDKESIENNSKFKKCSQCLHAKCKSN